MTFIRIVKFGFRNLCSFKIKMEEECQYKVSIANFLDELADAAFIKLLM